MSQDDKIATALRVIAGLERELAETRGDLARDHAERLAERADNVQQRKALVEELQKREATCGNCGETIIWKLGPLADEITRLRASAQRLNRRAQPAESLVAKLERQIKTQPVMKLRDNTALVQELATLRAKFTKGAEMAEAEHATELAALRRCIGRLVDLYERTEPNTAAAAIVHDCGIDLAAIRALPTKKDA